MPKENNNMQVDIENLFKQNVNDLSAIKELYRKLKEVEEKFSQIKYIDSNLAYKLKKEYESLKRIILDENVQAKLSNDIEAINSQLETIVNGQLIIIGNGTDVTEKIDSGLKKGYNILIKGDIKTSRKIIINKPNQTIIQEHGTWFVTHNDTVIEVLSYNNKILVNIDGSMQLETNKNISCIVVGQGGTESAEKGRNCNLSHTQIKHFKGNGIRWRNGARLNLYYTEIHDCIGHGVFADIGCKDNNDGNFDNLTVVNCKGYGVYLKKYNSTEVQSDVISDNIGSMQSGNNTFRNTKCFGNSINFVIETNSNTGTIFSEDKTNSYDKFIGNKNTIKYLGDIESSNNFINNGDNEIEYEDSFNKINRNNIRSKKIIVSDTFSGINEIYQSGNNTFVDTIKDTNNEVIIKHEKGSASSRTDEFQKIKIGNSYMRFLTQKKIQLEGQIIESGKYLKIDYGESIPVPYDAIIKHFVVLNQENSLVVTAFNRRLDSGWYRPFILLYNPTEFDVTLNTSSTIDYTAFY